jgi:hypothetical protein
MVDKRELQCCNHSLPVVDGSAKGTVSTQHVVVEFLALAAVEA